LPAVQKRSGADDDFQAPWAHASNQEHQVSPRGASDWWRESVRKSVSVHQDEIRGSAIVMEQFCVEISRVGHFRRHALKPRLLELAVCGSCRLIDSESAAIVVHRQVGSNQRLRLVRSTVQV